MLFFFIRYLFDRFSAKYRTKSIAPIGVFGAIFRGCGGVNFRREGEKQIVEYG